ncbi:MAG: DUF2911 domain-containing protein [Saprospiraceae bacterium]|jgi:hypothetical protein
MKISLVNFLALLLAVVFTACGEAPSTTSETAEETTATTSEEDAGSETVLSGDNFEVVITDGEASSPRKQLTGTAAGAAVTIDYGSPFVKGRTIWGDLVPYDKVWRTGANAATTIEFATDVTIEGQSLAAGKYALFTIPGMESWQVVFNTTTDQWGSGSYDEANNALVVTVTPQAREEMAESMDFTLDGDAVVLHWERLMVPFTVGAAQ